MSKAPKKQVTKADIIQGIIDLGVKAGDCIELHSSLSNFGHVVGGADTILDALQEVITDQGSIIMSAFLLGKPLPPTDSEAARGVTGIFPICSEDYVGPLSTGQVTAAFAVRDDVLKSPGIGRVCSWGRQAELLTKGYGELLELRGKALFLGAEFYSFSSMHKAEDFCWTKDVWDYFQYVPQDLKDKYSDQYYISYRRPGDFWHKIEALADANSMIQRNYIGDAKCMLLEARPVVELYAEELKRDLYGFYDIDPNDLS